MRYEAVLGPNTKQWWLYDNETNEYCDPPICVIKKLNHSYADGLVLERIANADNDWIADKNHRYKDIEI